MTITHSSPPQPLSPAPTNSGLTASESNETTQKSVRPENSAPLSPLHSVEAFEGYCSQVQARLAEHAAQRTHFLQNAHDRLTRLLHTARAVEDTALYNELWQHRVAVRELLEALNQFSSSAASPASASSPVSPLAPAPAAFPAPPVAANPGASPVAAPPTSTLGNAAQNSAASPAAPSLPPAPSAPSASPLPASGPAAQNANGSNGHEARLETAKTTSSSSAAPRSLADSKEIASLPSEVPSNNSSENRSNGAFYAPVEQAPRPMRHPVRPLADIEADAARLREHLRDWNQRYPLREAAVNGGNGSNGNGMQGLHVPNCLRLRAVACRMRRLEEEAGDTEVLEVTELSHDIEDLLDDAGDEEYTVALDYDIDPLPTAYQWGELAERYEETAHAEEAFAWWTAHRSILAVADIQNLAEAVAAIQQRFNRLLFRIGARDPFQQQLFDDLRLWAKEAQCYLHSLRPKVPIAELIEKAQTIDEAWEQAREPLRALEDRQRAIEDVVQMVAAPSFGAQEAHDEQRLQAALLHCRELRIPYSDRHLRDALLPWASFLESDERFKELLREITLEWERRQEAGKAEAMDEEPTGALDELRLELEAVRQVTKGKRCLLLGGTCREENRRKIEEALQLSELVWPSTKPSDPLAKFDTELRHADIVALLTRFSRKEWKNAQDICARDGKKFVHLTTGYGVAQVVRHFYTQIAPQGVAH